MKFANHIVRFTNAVRNLSLAPGFSRVWTGARELETVSTVSTDGPKPLKRLSTACAEITPLAPGVTERAFIPESFVARPTRHKPH